MHPPEPIYPCYLPVLGEFNRMTPHEGPSTSLPELGARFESAGGDCGNRSTAGTPRRRTRPSLYHLPPVSARPSIRSSPFPAFPQSRIDPSSAHLFPLGAPVVGGRRTRFRVALLFLWVRIAGRGAASAAGQRPAPAAGVGVCPGWGCAATLSGCTCFRLAHPL